MATTPVRRLVQAPFGALPDARAVELYTLRNRAGMEARLMTYGATIVSLTVPDRQGGFDNVVLGHADLDGYLQASPYLGAVVGRYGNRIAKGRFTLDGATVQLTVNDGENHLHGGARGFDKVLWTANSTESNDGASVTLAYASPDGEEGYPGSLEARVTYALRDRNELRVDYHATTDRATPVNLTQHSYFNLAEAGRRDILDHELAIMADAFTPVDAGLIPTGEMTSVEGTPFDFRTPTAIGARIDGDHEQLLRGSGYDHNFVLTRSGEGLRLAARVFEPTTGRMLEILTTEPGIQFYSGNFLDGTITGATGVLGHRSGFCLETQHYPDSPNQPSFPNAILRPGEEYRSTTIFAFGVAPR